MRFMEVKISAINFKITEKLESYVEKKVNKLGKFVDSVVSLEVFLKVVKFESAENKEAEIKIKVPGVSFFAEKTCDSFEEAIDKAVEAMEKQLKKYKESH